MQINHSANVVSSSAPALGRNTATKAQDARVAIDETRALDDRQAQKSQADAQQRFDVDQQVITLLEREHGNNAQAQSHDVKQVTHVGQSDYDAPSSQNKSAVAAYQSVGNIAQRDNIQQVFGVDLFA